MIFAIIRINTTPANTEKKVYFLSWYFPLNANIKINPQKGDNVAINAERTAIRNTT